MQRVTVGFGDGLRELVIPDGWTAFVIDGRIYQRVDDGGFDFVKRVEAKVTSDLPMKTASESGNLAESTAVTVGACTHSRR